MCDLESETKMDVSCIQYINCFLDDNNSNHISS